MKKLLLVIFLFFITNTYAIDNFKYVTAPSGLRLRENPDINSRIIITIPYREKVEVTEEKSGIVTFENIKGKWTKVNYKTYKGWIFGGFLEDSQKVHYENTIKTVIKEIDLLPSIFYALLDKPKNIYIYKSYNKKTEELIKEDKRISKSISYTINKNNLLEIIEIFNQGISHRDGTEYKESEKYLIQYDVNNRIIKIINETHLKFIFEIKYYANVIEVAKINPGGEVKYTFDLIKKEKKRQYKDHVVVTNFNYISSDLVLKDIINTPGSQALYHEYIYKYDRLGHLVFYLDIHYDEPIKGNWLTKDPWGYIYKLEY